ncbi:hypothetical protein [Halopiger xanaduensis]|uniref:Uncharacterized protein n=1 Tax=Halopiger xanaduensis (strain DSM 18323 / JCM 14033 / SH-6) TaxID=797210 RepID=F8D7Y0_HALXS|nr:hypothetical protein [Halopiger xanaduensis]AEH36712.1 hypothetical protein Halxa_2087 [Halopiger xanaduensis SH-6]
MSDDTEPDLSVGEFVEYCRTQAGLLSGQVETMGKEADELLDEIEETVADIRSRLEEQQGANTKGTATPTSTADPGADDVDVEDVEEMAADLEEKQTIVEAKQARMQAFQELAADYTELAEELQSDAEDGRAAMTRVVEFELDRDAPAYFDERQTLAEAAADATESDDSEPTEVEPE